MSSILKALEKASKTRATDAPHSGGEKMAVSAAVERQLREDAERHRRATRMLVIALLAAVALLGSAALAIGWMLGRDKKPVQPSAAVAAMTPIATATPVPAPTPEPPPPQVVYITVTPAPTPAPATPTPQPTATPEATPAAARTATPAPAPRFQKNQVIAASEAGVEIGGVFYDGRNSTVMIDGEAVDLGRKRGGVRPLAINRDSRLIEAEVDDAGGTVIVFIRY